MDWAKIFFCLYLAVSNGASLNTNNSKKENLPKIVNLNSTVSNLTKNAEETLEGSPSETIHFKNPVIFRELKKDVSVNKKLGAAPTKVKNNQPRSGADLNKEANEYRPVMSFTESAVPNMHRQWQVLPEVARYRVENEFESPIPIIESQSFVNKPRMTSTQINYSPQGNLEGRHYSPGHEEYPETYSNNDDRSYPSHNDDRSYPNHNDDRSYQEPEKHPGRGHTVHTETTHDYGRFLPVTYKSKIEMEAEALIKKQKAQNASSSERPEQNDRDNNQRAPGYYSRYEQPVNTAFFHKGGFENSYKFPEDHHNDQRQSYGPEKYPQHAYDQRQPVTPNAEGYSYGPRRPVTSTETYKPQYSYPTERYPSSPHRGPPNAPRQYDSSTEKYSPTYADDGEKSVPPYPETTPHSPRQYGSTVEQPPPHYHSGEKSVPPYPETTPHSHRQYGSSVEQSPPHYHNGEKSVSPYPENTPHSHRQYGSSVEQPPPHYHDGGKSVPQYPENNPHSHRQYGSSVEQPPSHYHNGEKSVPQYPENTPHSHRPYSSSVEQPPPQYHNEEKFLTSYNDNLNQPLPHTEPEPKEYQRPYSNNPVIESPVSLPDPPQYTKHSVTDIPHSNEPYTKTIEDVNGEKAYYSTFKSLMDLYRSIGFHFQPFSLDDIPIIQPPGFAMRNPFDTKFVVSSPLSVSSEDFHSKSNVPNHLRNTNSHTSTVQSYDQTGRPYSDTSYSKEVSNPGRPYFRDQPVRGKYSNYPEQVPFDSNRSPVVSTEHYDSPENPRPELNSQVESPKETFVGGEYDVKTYSSSKSVKDTTSDEVKVKGIRIKDYDSKTYFGNPSQKNVYSSAESDFSSGASPPDFPNHSHSVVRENPYNMDDHYSGEVRTTYRPRVYRQKVIVEDLNPTVNSEEKTPNFHSSDKRNKFHSSKETDRSRESSRDTFGSYPVSNEDQNKYSLPDSEMPMKPANKSPKTKSRSNRKSKNKHGNSKGEMDFDDQEERSNRKRKTGQNYRTTPFQGDFSYNQPEQRSKHTENQESRSSKKNGKRSSQRSPKKHKPNSRSQRDHMRAEGSTYHWGMERHKGTDGFFQYANVPGAKAFEYGYRMGGPEHTRERHHKTKGTHSKIKVNWEDENGDTGDHYWEFNHDSREDDGEERKPKEKPKRESEE